MSTDFPLPLDPSSEHDPEFHNPWNVGRGEPSDFITLWPGDAPPTLDDVIAALQSQCKGKVELLGIPSAEVAASTAGEGKQLWTAILQLPESDGHFALPVIVWAEAIRNVSAESVKHLKAEHIKWAIGLETILWPPDPLAHFLKLLRLLGRAAPDSPAILDVNKEGWHTRQELDELLLDESNVIGESILWFVHAVGTDVPPTPASKVWVYTQGLDRCGFPELEILAVPHPAVGLACALTNAIGELIIENGMPDPGEPMHLSNDLVVTLHPWREVASNIEEMPGHPDHRQNHYQYELDGVRAAICGGLPDANGRFSWPADVIQQLGMRSPSALFKTERAAKRQEQLARSSWNDLARAFATLAPKARDGELDREAVFLVQASFQRTHGKPSHSDTIDRHEREHLWCEVKCFHSIPGGNARAEAAILNDPMHIEHLRPGDIVKIDCGLVSDWQVLTRRGHFSPTNVEGLLQTIQQINAEIA